MEPVRLSASVEGHRYDTATAVLLADDAYWDGYSHERQGRNQFLFRTQLRGLYFVLRRSLVLGEQDCLVPVSRDEAMALWSALPRRNLEFRDAFPSGVGADALLMPVHSPHRRDDPAGAPPELTRLSEARLLDPLRNPLAPASFDPGAAHQQQPAGAASVVPALDESPAEAPAAEGLTPPDETADEPPASAARPDAGLPTFAAPAEPEPPVARAQAMGRLSPRMRAPKILNLDADRPESAEHGSPTGLSGARAGGVPVDSRPAPIVSAHTPAEDTPSPAAPRQGDPPGQEDTGAAARAAVVPAGCYPSVNHARVRSVDQPSAPLDERTELAESTGGSSADQHPALPASRDADRSPAAGTTPGEESNAASPPASTSPVVAADEPGSSSSAAAGPRSGDLWLDDRGEWQVEGVVRHSTGRLLLLGDGLGISTSGVAGRFKKTPWAREDVVRGADILEVRVGAGPAPSVHIVPREIGATVIELRACRPVPTLKALLSGLERSFPDIIIHGGV